MNYYWIEAGPTLNDGTHQYRVFANPAHPTMVADYLTEEEAAALAHAKEAAK